MFDISSPSVYIPTIFLTIVACFVSFLYKDSKRHTRDNTTDLPYFGEISLSMNYIDRNILEDGRFQYKKHIDSDITCKNDVYNALRHAGVLYSMYMYEKYGLVEKFKESRIKASKYFIERYIKEIKEDMCAVVSIPEEELLNIKIAKTGAAGIALCALSNLYNDNEIELTTLQKIGNFLLYMQKDSGDVYAYYDLEKDEINKDAEAVYYAGEAAAGLMYLYEINPDTKWFEAAKKIITYLAEIAKNEEFNVNFDNWAALAIEKMFQTELLTEEEQALFRAYAVQMSIPTLSEQITNRNNSYYGAFKDNVRPCSLGAIMEGLASIYNIIDNKNLKKVIFKSLSIGNLFLSKVQVKTGEQAGGLPNSANWVRKESSPNASIIRIDNVQHVATGWLKFQNILKVTGNY